VADWVIWLVVAGLLLGAELLTLTLVLGLLSVAAVAAAATALLDLPVAGQLVVFSVVSVLGVVLLRPFERLHRQQPAISTGTAALTGRTGVVTEAISDQAGRVKLGGESWAARTLTHGRPVEVGSTVVVSSVEGATLVVYPEEL
jgi:membrane protein implicated in regulation of membrane protease activity